MLTDLELILGEKLVGPVGSGGTRQSANGTWLAWAVIDTEDQGMYGYGANEGHAIKALEAKLSALGKICGAAMAEAESGYRVRSAAEAEKFADKMEEFLGELKSGGGLSKAFAEPEKKKAEDGGN